MNRLAYFNWRWHNRALFKKARQIARLRAADQHIQDQKRALEEHSEHILHGPIGPIGGAHTTPTGIELEAIK
jgi:hypothetical protein